MKKALTSNAIGQVEAIMWIVGINNLSGTGSLMQSDTVTKTNMCPCRQMGVLLPSCYIDVTGVSVTEKAHYLAQIEKLVGSHVLHGSESLCKLLRYLAKHAVDHPGASLKEYQIATEVFGRQPDFDPQLDSMVRVQAGRLRTKLAEYYSSEGADDPVWVELPKGTYLLSFHQGTHGNGRSTGSGSYEQRFEVAAANVRSRRSGIVLGALSVALVAALVVIGILLLNKKPTDTVHAGGGEGVPAVYRIFWKGFLTGPEEPWVIFSNAAFVGHPYTGMRYYDAVRDAKEAVFDHYTGVGEVLAVHSLDGVFDALHQKLKVKRGSLFSLDDAKNNDLIFIGSPSENLTLLDIPSTHEFVFQRVDCCDRKGDTEIINVHPQPGEGKSWLASPSHSPLVEDFAVVALVHGLNPSRYELILAGTTTIGTQAAVEYVTRQNSLEELLLRLSVSNSGELKPFEAVIRVKVAHGVPVSSELVALRKGA
jgi:hypothetical protein